MIRFFSIIFALFILSSAILPAFALEPLDRVKIENPRLVNSFGVAVGSGVNVNQQVQIAANVQSNGYSGNFVYIAQVKNSDGVVVSLGWITGQLNAGQNWSPALSWSTRTAGTYDVEIFVWDSLTNQDALTDYMEMQIIVS